MPDTLDDFVEEHGFAACGKSASYQGIALAMPQVACHRQALLGAEVGVSTSSAAC